LQEKLIALIFNILSVLVRLLPSFFLAPLGKLLGWSGHKFIAGERERASQNIRRAEIAHFTEEEKEEIIEKSFLHFGQFLLEFLQMPALKKSSFEEHFQLSGHNHLHTAYRRQQGVIIYTAHYGNWEWLGPALVKLGYPVAAIAAEQQYLDDRINEIRKDLGLEVIKTGFSLRRAYKALEDGKLLLVLGDQHAGDSGLELEFFGRPASVYRGAVRLASKTGAALLPVFIGRQDYASFSINIKPEVKLPQELTPGREREILKKLLEITEKEIIANPEQWNWFYRRWKLADRRLEE